MRSIFRITDLIPRNNNIDRYEYFECEPVAGANLNDPGDIRLTSKPKIFLRIPAKAFYL